MRMMTRSLLLIPALFAALGVQAQAPAPSTISVTGEGSITAVPDEATVTTGVETRAQTPTEALEGNSTTVRALLDVLEDHGIEERDVQTSGFNLSPQYRHPRDGNGEPILDGYSVSNQLRIRVRELDRLGTLLEALVAAGSNRLSGIDFGHSGLAELTDQARRAAVVEARRRAELYAAAAGVRVGPVISISELGQSYPQPMYRVAVMEMAAAPPVAAGEQQVQASVQVVFGLATD